jgi:hypothetical protein
VWADLPEEELLEQRFCDLGLTIEGTIIEERVARLYDDLVERKIRFGPHVRLSCEWSSPDGFPGIAIPFYLAHLRIADSNRVSANVRQPLFCTLHGLPRAGTPGRAPDFLDAR